MTDHITAIKGADGLHHGYRTSVFPLRQLVDLELKLGRIMGGAAGPGIDYLSGLFSIDAGGIHLAADPDKSTDSTKLGRAIAAIPGGILEAGGYDFVAHILSRTSREVDLGGAESGLEFVGLTDPHLGGGGNSWMDHIYPGNLGEMHLAVFWVLCINFSPFGRGPSFGWRGLWNELTQLIPMPSTESTETTEPRSAGAGETKTQIG